MRRSWTRSSSWLSRGSGRFLRRTLGMRFPAVETAYDRLPQHGPLGGIGGLDHAFCQRREFLARELSLGIQLIGEPNYFRLLLGWQELDLADDLLRRHGSILRLGIPVVKPPLRYRDTTNTGKRKRTCSAEIGYLGRSIGVPSRP